MTVLPVQPWAPTSERHHLHKSLRICKIWSMQIRSNYRWWCKICGYRLLGTWRPRVKTLTLAEIICNSHTEVRGINCVCVCVCVYSVCWANSIGNGKDESDVASVRANYAMRKQCGIYYFEIKVISKGVDGHIGIGFCRRINSLDRFPGKWPCGYIMR